MKTSNRIFKTLDICFGNIAIIFGFFLSKVFSLLGLLHRSATPQKVLFVKFCCQGDAILSLFALQSFKKKYPNTKMVMAAGVKTKEVYETSNLFDHLITLDISGQRGIAEMFGSSFFSFLVKLHHEGPFDTVVNMDVYFRFSTLFGFWVRAGKRLGFRTSKIRSLAFTQSVIREKRKLEQECFYDLFEPFDISSTQDESISFSSFHKDKNQAQLLLKQMGWDGLSPLVALFPGSNPNWPEKRWPVSKFSSLMAKILSIKKITFVIIGQDFENDLALFLILRHPHHTINLAGKTPFKLLAGTLSLCSLFIGNDSGPMHMSDALGIPTLAIFGPTDEKKWGPKEKYSQAITNTNIDCRPCYYISKMPACEHRRCLTELNDEEVFAFAKQILIKEKA